MKCEDCNKPVLSDYAKGLRDGRNIGLFGGLFMGSLLTATLFMLLSAFAK